MPLVRPVCLCAVFFLLGCGSAQHPPAPPPAPFDVTGFAQPESVLHDAEADVYLVSNIAGNPMEADGNGFISRVAPDGRVLARAWIEGLDAPKGMAIAGDELFVADIGRVRRFDRRTGRPLGDIALEGALLVNDLVAGPDGSVYVTDMGMGGMGPSGPTGPRSDAIYRIATDGSVHRLAEGVVLGNPNGLAWKDGLWVASFGSGELYRLTDSGQPADARHPPAGQLDGLVALDDGRVAVTSWESGAIYAGPEDGVLSPLVTDLKGPADLGYDRKRQRLLIPVLLDDRVLILPLGESGDR